MSITAYHFWSPTCAPCKAIKPAVEDLKEEFSYISWVSVNTHDDKDGISSKYSVTLVPTIVIETKNDNGDVVLVEKQSGTNIAQYYRIIRSALRSSQQS
jgi:thiol-disulfide isomerase/thioredoxin